MCIVLALVFSAGGAWAGTISLNFSENSGNQVFTGGALIGPLGPTAPIGIQRTHVIPVIWSRVQSRV